MPTPRARSRLLAVLAIAAGAPICAEYLQAYLTSTGDLAGMVIGLVYFAPLYGGAALLIRDLAIRTGRGWMGVLVLAAAFGLAMTGVIDLSMFGQHRSDVPYWEQLRGPTSIASLGLSVFPTISWVLGHVMMSVGTPLALHHALAPSHRGRPLMGPVATGVVTVLWLADAVFVHVDGRSIYGYELSVLQAIGVLTGVLALVALAFSPAGRPVPTIPAEREAPRRVPPLAALAAGVLLIAALDLAPPLWIGVAVQIVVIVLGIVLLRRIGAHPGWGPAQIGCLACGLILGTVLLGVTSPLPPGVSQAAKLGQSGVMLVLALGVTVLVLRRALRSVPSRQSSATAGQVGRSGD